MNPKLQKTNREIERTKEKITELQTLLPELERQKTELENTEIVKAVRSACVDPGDIETFLESYRKELRRTAAKPAQAIVPAGSEKNNQETEAMPDDTD